MKLWYWDKPLEFGSKIEAFPTKAELIAAIQKTGRVHSHSSHIRSKEFSATKEGLIKALEFGTQVFTRRIFR